MTKPTQMEKLRAQKESLRRASLRRQIALLERVRDTMAPESGDDYERWAEALIPLTDKILHELMVLEGVPPYPHPMHDHPWRDALAAAVGAP